MHAPDIIEELSDDKLIGYLETPTADAVVTASQITSPDTTIKASSAPETESSFDSLDSILSAPDFEQAAKRGLTAKTWAFYSSAATDLVTLKNNKELVRRIMIRPRILRNVTNINLERSILGFKCSAPFFIAPAAMGRLAHPDGELALSRAAANEGIIQCVSPPTVAATGFNTQSNVLTCGRFQATRLTHCVQSSKQLHPHSPSSSNSTSTQITKRQWSFSKLSASSV